MWKRPSSVLFASPLRAKELFKLIGTASKQPGGYWSDPVNQKAEVDHIGKSLGVTKVFVNSSLG